jgi:hypothetical protein
MPIFLAATALATTSAWSHQPPAGFTQTRKRMESMHFSWRTERQFIVTPALSWKVRPPATIWLNQLVSAPRAKEPGAPAQADESDRIKVKEDKKTKNFFNITRDSPFSDDGTFSFKP